MVMELSTDFHLLDSSSDSGSSERSTSTGTSDGSSSYMEHTGSSVANMDNNLQELMDTLTTRRSFKVTKGLTRMSSSKYRRKSTGGGPEQKNKLKKLRSIRFSGSQSSRGHALASSELDALPNYLKATKSSDVRKLSLQASSANPIAASPRTKPATASRGIATLRPVRRLTKMASFRLKRPSMKSCSGFSPSLGSGVQRATCSSASKNSKFPAQMEINLVGDDDPETSSAMKVCSFSYCSLHGHRQASAPSLKRLKSARKRVKMQRNKKLGSSGEFGAKGLLDNSTEDVEKKENAGNEGSFVAEGVEIETTAKTESGHIDQVQCVDEVSKIDSAPRIEQSNSAETTITVEGAAEDGTVFCAEALCGTAEESTDSTSDDSVHGSFGRQKLNGLWSLLYHQMVSDVAENGELESPLGTCTPELNVAKCPDESDQQVELQQSDAVKLLQEAVNKILAQTQNDSSDESIALKKTDMGESNSKESIASISIKLEEEKLKPVTVAGKKLNPLVSKRWSSLKKYVLMRRFIKAMEKMRTFSRTMPRSRSSELHTEQEKVRLRNQLVAERKNTDVWMLDYALRKVITELEPAQERRVALLVSAFETVNPVSGRESRLKSTGSHSPLSSHSQVSLESSGVDGDIGTEGVVGSKDCQGEIHEVVETVEEFRHEKVQGREKVDEDPEIPGESEGDGTIGESVKASLGRRKFSGLWYLIHQQMVSDVTENGGLESPVYQLSIEEEEKEEDGNKFPEVNVNGYDSGMNRAATPDEAVVELRETDAIKLLRDAITKILAQSQNYFSNGGIVLEKAVTGESNGKGMIPSHVEEEFCVDKMPNIDKKPTMDLAKKPNQLVSKRWSNLKKYILMKRFIKAMEKMRTFSPRIPRSLSSEVYPEQEKVSLRRQTTEEKKSSEEWMLDYALRKVISELEPAQKRKVSLLVHAFETVNPVPGSVSRLKPTGSYPSLVSHSQDRLDSSLQNGTETSTENGDSSEVWIGEVQNTSLVLESKSFTTEQKNPIACNKSQVLRAMDIVSGSKDVQDQGTRGIETIPANGEGYQEEIHEVAEIVQGFSDEKGQGLDQGSLIDSAPSSELFSLVESRTREAGVRVFLEETLCSTKEESVTAREKVDEDPQFPGKSELNSNSDDSVKASLGSRKFSGLWYLIHQQMVSDVAENGGLEPPVYQVSMEEQEEDVNKFPGINDRSYNSGASEMNKAATPDEVIQESDAVKLLREAINKILAQPQEQYSVRQTSNKGMVSVKMETGENTGEGMMELSDPVSIDADKMPEINKKSVTDAGKMRTQLVSKRWSNLKKYIVMKRFIKATEKMRTFRPRIPRSLSSEVYSEQEKVSLRSQSMGERKNSEEWMLDYALRKVVSELDPPQQRKVALLVEAFETVSPFPGSGSRSKSTESYPSLGIHSHGSTDSSVQNVTEIGIENGEELRAATEIVGEVPSSVQGNCGPTPPEESGPHTAAATVDEPHLESKKYKGLWFLIYKNMVSGLATEGETQPTGPIVEGNNEENNVADPCISSPYPLDQRMESEGIRQSKLEAIKLVLQAIDEILLPDNEDSSSDDQEAAEGTIPEKGPEDERCSIDGGTFLPKATLSAKDNPREIEKVNDQCVHSTPESQLKSHGAAKLEGNTASHQEVDKPVTTAGKNWNNLRKVILLKRFVKALEKVRTFNPRQAQQLPLEPDGEQEKVDLKHQDTEDRKNGEEYLVDYALRQVVSRLTPARRKKVHLLVEAFETITPPFGK